jgi:hypothetical protein
MTRPTVTEITTQRARVDHDDFGDEPARTPRRPPYNRAAIRAAIQRSLDYDFSQHDVYPNRSKNR